jgi:hypothetical protein
MCTMIARQIEIAGSGKGTSGWFALRQANVSFDHPFDAPMEHALNIDFVDESRGPGARVAVELDVPSARALVQTILAVLNQARAGGYLEPGDESGTSGVASTASTSSSNGAGAASLKPASRR